MMLFYLVKEGKDSAQVIIKSLELFGMNIYIWFMAWSMKVSQAESALFSTHFWKSDNSLWCSPSYLVFFVCYSCPILSGLVFTVAFLSFAQSSVDFPAKYQDWTATDPLDLFQAQIVKTESNPKVFFHNYFLSVLNSLYLLIK